MDTKNSGKKITIGKGALIGAAMLLAVVLGYTGFKISENSGIIVFQAGANEEAVESENTGSVSASGIARESCGDSNGVSGVSSLDGTSGNSAASGGGAEGGGAEEIKVYVVGCVRYPGVVTLRTGQLICDAIEAAGGALPQADLENINLVYPLRQNIMLRILPKSSAGTGSAPGNVSDGILSGTGKGAILTCGLGTGIDLTGSQSTFETPKINLNTATAEELETLPGIGEATARDIIDYREKHGGFKKIGDIMNVPGIKDSRYNRIKDLITAS